MGESAYDQRSSQLSGYDQEKGSLNCVYQQTKNSQHRLRSRERISQPTAYKKDQSTLRLRPREMISQPTAYDQSKDITCSSPTSFPRAVSAASAASAACASAAYERRRDQSTPRKIGQPHRLVRACLRSKKGSANSTYDLSPRSLCRLRNVRLCSLRTKKESVNSIYDQTNDQSTASRKKTYQSTPPAIDRKDQRKDQSTPPTNKEMIGQLAAPAQVNDAAHLGFRV